MPLDFLRKIEHAEFPLTVTDDSEIADLEILKGACLVIAAIPPRAGGSAHGEQRRAVVLQITQDGRSLLARHRL